MHAYEALSVNELAGIASRNCQQRGTLLLIYNWLSKQDFEQIMSELYLKSL